MSVNPSQRQFEERLKPHAAACYKTAYRLTGNQADAEDLVQELFLKLYRQFEQWRGMEEPAAWIMRVLYNLHVDRYRKRMRTHGANEYTRCDEEWLLPSLASSEPTPQAAAENSQRQQCLLAALDRLNADERLLVTLHLLEGHTLSEVSERLDTPVGTLKARLHRCKARLKKYLNLQPFFGN